MTSIPWIENDSPMCKCGHEKEFHNGPDGECGVDDSVIFRTTGSGRIEVTINPCICNKFEGANDDN